MGKYLCLSDIHATRLAPSSCTDSYWPDLLELLRQSVELAQQYQVRGVVWAGDVLHHKAPRRTGHDVVQDLIKVIQAYRCPVWIVPGNHDLQHDRIDSIEETQPLGVLYLAGARRLEGWAEDNHPLYGVPWLQDWNERNIEAALEGFRTQVFSRTLIVTHAPVYPPGKEPPYECTPAKWWAAAAEDGDMGHGLFYGHVHEPHGTYAVGGLTFCNNGALSRGSLDEYNLRRRVGVTLWDDGTGEFEFTALNARPPEQVFRIADRDRKNAAQDRMDVFLDAAGTVELGVLSIEGVLDHFRTLNLTSPELALAEELLMAEAGGS